jgi:hypothetical protein
MNNGFTVGKYMSPYGKSTSGRFKLLPFKDGLGRCGFRVVFSFSFVFWNRRGLIENHCFIREASTDNGGPLTALGAAPRIGPSESSEKRRSTVVCQER